MNYDRDTFEHRYNPKWDKFIFYIKDSYQKLCLDHSLKMATEETEKSDRFISITFIFLFILD